MGYLIVIILSVSLGGYAGFRLGGLHTARENDSLRTQLMLQEKFSRTWASEATEKYTLSNQIATQQTANLGSTMNMVIQLLSSYQFQNVGSINQTQNEKVSELIAKAKSISGLHE
jgi:hypothetical protein